MSAAEGAQAIERAILKFFNVAGSDFGFGETYWSIAFIAGEIGVSREYCRAALRSLTDQGLAQYASGLFSEDGEVRGAGYGPTIRARGAHTEDQRAATAGGV